MTTELNMESPAGIPVMPTAPVATPPTDEETPEKISTFGLEMTSPLDKWNYWSVMLFVGIYYIRPHEWIEICGKLNVLSRTMAFALGSLIILRLQQGKLNIKEVLKTRHDWIMGGFLWYILHTAADSGQVWEQINSLFAMYLVTVHALTNIDRLVHFARWWCILLLIIAGLAVLSKHGFDPFNSERFTDAFQGRLCLGLSLYRNPNSLAHSIVPAFPLIYYLFVWRRLVVGHWNSVLFLIPGLCLIYTRSRGGFMSTAAAGFTMATFGRPIPVQVAGYVLAYAFGTSLLMALPRMQEMNRAKSDKGVQGRMFAWEFGWNSMQTYEHGLGYRNFRPMCRAIAFQTVANECKAEAEFRVKRWMRIRRSEMHDFQLLVFDHFSRKQQNQDTLTALTETEKYYFDRQLPPPVELKEQIDLAQKDHKTLDQEYYSLQETFTRKKDALGAESLQHWTLEDLAQTETVRKRQLEFSEILDAREVQLTGLAAEHLFKLERERMTHAPHCSYVEVGAELGKQGLWLWLGIIYFCFKTLFLMRGTTFEEERIRRSLFGVMVATVVSAWMTNLCFRGSFYVTAGIIAAYHRDIAEKRRLAREEQRRIEEEERRKRGGDEEESMNVTKAVARGVKWPPFRFFTSLAIDIGFIFVFYIAVQRTWLYIMYDWQGF